MSRSAGQAAFEALSDPTRRRILHMLSESEETSAGDLADAIEEIGRTAVSSHLRVLRNADLIIERRVGRFRYYSLHPDGPVQDALGFLQTILSQGISRTDNGESVKPATKAKAAIATSQPAAGRRRNAS